VAIRILAEGSFEIVEQLAKTTASNWNISHTGLLRKIYLSPEISSSNDMVALSKTLIKHWKRILNLTFHSNSLMVGKNLFIKSNGKLKKFYKNLETYFEYLASATNFLPLALSEVCRLLEN